MKEKWQLTPMTPDETRRMAYYRREAARKVVAERERFPNAEEMCKTCAFRVGAEASKDAAVLDGIERCLLENGVFYCHGNGVIGLDGFVRHVGGPDRACVGYMRLISTA